MLSFTLFKRPRCGNGKFRCGDGMAPFSCLAVRAAEAAWCSTGSTGLRRHPQVRSAQGLPGPGTRTQLRDSTAPDALMAESSHTSLGPKAKFPEFRVRQAVWGRKVGFLARGIRGTGWRWGKRTSGGEMSSNGNRNKDAGPPTPRQDGRQHGEKDRGPRVGEGEEPFPGSRGSRRGLAPLRDDLPSAGCRTHMVNGAEGQANGWAGLAGGGRRVDSSPAATPAVSARSRPLLAPLRRRRRRARPRCPECTARRAAPSARERRKV